MGTMSQFLNNTRRGLRDWMWQRASAVIMLAYLLLMFVYFINAPAVTYTVWHHFFSVVWIKVASIIAVACLCLHAWVGVWTVITDYIKPACLRMSLLFAVLLALVGYGIWGIMILGGV